MDLATLFFRNRHLLVLAIVVIVVAGVSAIQTMPRLEDPVITARNPLIITPVPGADAERVEALVADPVEDVLREIGEIKNITSTARAGILITSVELRDEITHEDNDAVFSEIRNELDSAEASFPGEALSPVFDDNRGAVAYTLLVALKTPGAERHLGLLRRLADELADDLRNVPGTEIVRLFGEPDEEIRASVQPAEMAAMGLTAGEVVSALEAADARVPGGIIHGADSDLQLEVTGEFDTLERIGNAVIHENPDGAFLRLADIATLARTWVEPPADLALTNGERTILVGAKVRQDQRVDTWTADAKAAVERFQNKIGTGVEAEIIFEQNEYTSARLGTLTSNLLLGAAVIFCVVLLTMGWRSSLFIGSALPLVALATVFIVSMTGGKLHQMSIFGMIIALGLLIDNAIVVCDETNRGLRAGKERVEAVRGAVRHLFVPLLSSTFTTILAFMPILLLPGNAGDFVGSIGSSVIYALMASFLIAMTLVGSLAGLFGQRGREDGSRRWWRDGVGGPRAGARSRRTLEWLQRRPLVALPLASVLGLTGFYVASTLGVQFFPRVDRDMFELRFWLPTESSLQRTEQTARELEAVIREDDAVHEVHWRVGASFPPVYYNMLENRDNTPYYAQAVIEAADFRAVKRLIAALQARMDADFPQLQGIVRQFGQGPPAEADVEFRLFGEDITTLKRLGEEVRVHLAQHPDVLHTRTTILPGQPKLWLEAGEEDVLLTGLTLTDVATQLRGNLTGFTGGSVIEGLDELPVRVRYGESDRSSLQHLHAMNLTRPGSSGELIPLAALGPVSLRPETGAVTRRNGERMNAVRGWVKNEALPIDATREVGAQLEAAGFTLPEGYRIETGGESENQQEAVGNLFRYLPVLAVLMVAIIILSFRSVRLALLLFAVAAIASGYGFLATWAMGFPLSFNTILGTFGLVGLTFNDNIVVLAGIRQDPRARAGDPAAIAARTQDAMRHLVSTTLTTIGGFLPLLIFVGGDFWPPLAIVLAGGVGGATLAALVFTPTVYGLIARAEARKREKRGQPAGEEAEA